MLAPPHGADQPSVGAHQPRADSREPAPEVERCELTLELLAAPLARGEADAHDARQRVRQLRRVASPHRQTSGEGRERGPGADDVHAAAQSLDAPAGGGAHPIAQAIDPVAEIVFRRDDELRRSGWCRRTHVGDKVGNRDVGLVADRRNHRHRHSRDGARDDLLVEGPQVFNRSAPPTDDHDLHARDARDLAQGARNVRRRVLALHTRRADYEVRVPVAAPQDLDDVANRRAVERGHDADLAGQRGQRTLARRVEQPLVLQPLLQLIERELQRAEAVGLEVLADQLILALRLVD